MDVEIPGTEHEPQPDPERDVANLADDLRRLACVRGWIVDYFSPEAIRYRQDAARQVHDNAPFRFEPDDWFGFFERRGWGVRQKRSLAEEGARLGRPMSMPASADEESRRTFAGYVLLEPA